MAASEPRLRGPRSLVASLRFRITAASTIAVAIALVVGAFVVSEIQTRTLTDNVDNSLQVRAGDLGALLVEGRLPSVLSVRDAEEALVEVVAADGTVVAASANTGGESFLAERFVPDGVREIRTFERLPIENDEFRVIAQRIETSDGVFTIYVAEALEEVRESANVLNRSLVFAVPLLVLFVGGLTWFVVGRALAPVEAIRSEVAEISAAGLHRRVPEPAVRDEIGRLARTMNAMLERLEQVQRRQQRFVADASHELRSPLTNIRAEIEVDLARPHEASPLETERAVLEEAIRMERLVDDLLQLARSDSGQTTRTDPVDLDDIVFREIERARAPGAQRDRCERRLGRADGRRSRPAREGDPQPAGQCRPPRARARDRGAVGGRRRDRARRRRRRPRHPAGGPGAHLRALHPPRRGAGARGGRRRPRARDRA